MRREQFPYKVEISDNPDISEAIHINGEYYCDDIDLSPGSAEESWFFESLSETYLPLLGVFDRLEGEHIPFRLGVALSPLFGTMLGDSLLMKKYLALLDSQIEFGKAEMKRLENKPDLYPLAKHYFDEAVDRRAVFTTRYDGNLLKVLDFYRKKGKIEILFVPAAHSFLPFFTSFPETIRAQIETASAFYRNSMGINPQGFWLPELGWSPDLDSLLSSCDFSYTVTESHGLVFASPPPSRGTFFPVKTPRGLFVLARDFNAAADIARMKTESPYRDNNSDIGFELAAQEHPPFLAQNGARYFTGYKYRKADGSGGVYDPAAARLTAEKQSKKFLENIRDRAAKVSEYMNETPVCLCAFNADDFGRFWHEGPHFLESLFRQANERSEIQCMTPSEYLYQQPVSLFEVSLPEYSSWKENGYAEVMADSSNDWIYRHINRAVERMTELAERFYDERGLKERALNQAAREILLAQASDWPAILRQREYSEYARRKVEGSLRNFTTIYESLGSGHISTEWLTVLERRHNIFPDIDFRMFIRNR